MSESRAYAVSVVIPAYNAESTVAETLDALRAQTFGDWEATVVDDGSTDATVAIVESYVARDSRIRLVRQENAGAASARNTGLRHCRNPWLFFLDADDWVDATWLARAVDALRADETLDAVHCGWAYVDPSGRVLAEEYCPETGDLFDVFAIRCAFAIHACVVRRVLVDTAKGFDPAYRIAHDWVTWQRIARLGARFGRVPGVFAFYRKREGSLTDNAERLLDAAMRVMDLGHRSDPVLGLPADAPHAMGRSPEGWDEEVLNFICWTAGGVLARGGDPLPLVSRATAGRAPEDCRRVAENIANGALRALSQLPSAILGLWPQLGPRLPEFFEALESRIGEPGLSRALALAFDRFVLRHSALPAPFTLNRTFVVAIEVTQPITDVAVAVPNERLHVIVTLHRETIGSIELPVCDGVVPATVLRDAIAERCAWTILARFLEHGPYRSVEFRQEADGWGAWRDGRRVAQGLPDDPAERLAALHDAIGWNVLLTEVASGTPQSRLARAATWLRAYLARDHRVARKTPQAPWYTVEVTNGDRSDHFSGSALIEATVARTPVAAMEINSESLSQVGADLRQFLIDRVGYELCLIIVRETLLERAIDDGTTLRDRLTVLARRTAGSHKRAALPKDLLWAPGADRAFAAVASRASSGLVISQRPSRSPGTSVSRVAVLPAVTRDLIRDTERAAGTPVIEIRDGGSVVYAPDILWTTAEPKRARVAATTGQPVVDVSRRTGDRFGFDAMFARGRDPWSYESAYEQTKYEQTLALLPPEPIGRVLEIGCAEGHFTLRLAPRVSRVIAADISPLALERVIERCRDLSNVETRQLDLVRDDLSREFDLIVCSEMLYFIGGPNQLSEVAQKIAGALVPGGHLLTAHAHVLVDDPTRTGFDWDLPFGAATITRTFESTPGLRLVRELRTPLYRVSLFRRVDAESATPAEVIESDRFSLPVDSVAATIRWGGGIVSTRRGTEVTTDRLPILMYHRVAPTGVPSRDRYRVTPEVFEHHLRYLRDSGFRTIGFDDWQRAATTKRPIEGRAVILTFDDAFVDFREYAWPLLKHYGFGATVFVVSDCVGRWNEWDRDRGQDEPILDWPTILELGDQGVNFGAHGRTHRRLTALDPADIVREVVGSRAALERRLGRPVDAFAYPYGQHDAGIQHLVGACGFTYALTTEPRGATRRDAMLALPRLEAPANGDLRAFIATLAG